MLKTASILFRIGVIVVILAVAFLVYGVLFATRDDRAPKRDLEESGRVVRVMEVRALEIPRQWEGYATTRALRATDVRSQVQARVVERLVEDGAAVARGDVLVRLERTDFELRLQATDARVASISAEIDGLEVETSRLEERIALAEDEFEFEKWDYETLIGLRERGSGNDREVKAAKARLDRVQRELATLRQTLELIPSRRHALQARLETEQAQRRINVQDLERTEIVSPIDGVVQSIGVDAGDLLTVNTFVARVVDLTAIEVPVQLPVGAQDSVGVGDVVALEAGERDWEGRVERIAPESDPRSRSLTVFVVVRQQEADLLPGQFVRATVRSGRVRPTIIVPRRCAVGDRVLVVRENEIHSVAVEVGHHLEGSFDPAPAETQWVTVRQGLSEGDLVATSGLDALADGMFVSEVIR
ncbi:MAG: efflux RND transporter periplasmic adaptor subunit [Phycisphaerales bacterium]|nr:efflux RND transporter periplasmic adaptor subunit [Phycisphaerales bacterium]